MVNALELPSHGRREGKLSLDERRMRWNEPYEQTPKVHAPATQLKIRVEKLL